MSCVLPVVEFVKRAGRPSEDRPVNGTLVSRREFRLYNGFLMEEVFVRTDRDTVRVAWCLKPFEKTVVNGVANYCYNAELPEPTDSVMIETARRRCAELFCDVHGLDIRRVSW